MKNVFSLVSVLFLSAMTLNAIAYTDKTTEFKNYYENPHSTEHLAELLANVHVIIVPGMLNSLKEPFYFIHKDYKDYKDWFDAHKISYEILEPYSQKGTEANHEIILAAFERVPPTKKAFLIGHSYGGLFIITTLIKYPHLIENVAAFVSMQTPYYGSKITEALMKYDIVSSVTQFFFKNILAGSNEGFLELNPDFRKKWIEDENEKLVHLTQTIPLLNIATQAEGTLMQYFTQQNFDGLLETSSQCLNLGESVCVLLEEWEHTDTINEPLFHKPHVNRKHLLETMIEMTLAKKNAKLVKH